MDMFKKPVHKPGRKVKGAKQGKCQNARLESSVTSVSPSASVCSQQSGYDYAKSLYKSVIDVSITSNESKILHDSSGLHSSIKKFGETLWQDFLNTTKEWQIEGFVEKYKEMKTRAAMSKGNLHKKMVTFERWYVIINECELRIKGFLNKNDEFTSEAIVKRMDSHTVASGESLYKLKKFIVEGDASSMPHYIINRFACGFPEDWKLLKKKWIMFSKEGKPQDFQWEGHETPASLGDSSMCENRTGHSLQQSSCEESTNKIQDRNFAFSPLVARNEFIKRAVGLDSCNFTVEKHGSVNIENCLHLEQERINHVSEGNDPQCSKSATTTKENFLAPKRNFEIVADDSENSDSERDVILDKERNRLDSCYVSVEKKRINHVGERNFEIVADDSENSDSERAVILGKERNRLDSCYVAIEKKRINHVGERTDPQCSKSATTTKENFLAPKRSFEIAAGDSENPDNERAVILDKERNRLDSCYVSVERINHVGERNEPECGTLATTTKENFLAPKRRFKSAVDDSENLENKRAGILNKQTNYQDGKSKKEEVRDKKKKQSGGKRITNTTQTMVGNEILLEKWLPVLKDTELCFRGVRSVGRTKNSYTTASVKSRLTSDTVILSDGNTCKLIGHLYDEHKCLPNEIGSKFVSGMPVFWRKVLFRWIVYSKSTEVASTTRSTSSLLNNQQQGILKTSSRGRILFQPVKHWLGETKSSVINNMVDYSEEKQMEVLNSKHSHHLPEEEILISTSGKKKCGMVDKPVAQQQKNVKNAINSKRKKELVDRNVKKTKKDQQISRPNPDEVLNSDALGGNSCPNNEFENPTYFANSERMVLRSRNKHIVAKKESSNAIVDENKCDGIGKKPISRSTRSRKNINGGKLKENATIPVLARDDKGSSIVDENKSDGIGKNAVSLSNRSHENINGGKLKENATIPVLARDDKGSSNVGKSKQTTKKTNKKDEEHSLKRNDTGVDFTDFLGKPPRTLKQRKKLLNIVKTLSQNNKKNVDLFDDNTENDANCSVAWHDFIAVKDAASFKIGEETPRSKMLNGSYFKTPETSPSTSIFQLTPCDNDELLKYVHLQKKKNDKPAKKANTKKTKLPFMQMSSGNHAVDDAYAALLRGEPVPMHTISKEMRVLSDDSDLSSEFSY